MKIISSLMGLFFLSFAWATCKFPTPESLHAKELGTSPGKILVEERSDSPSKIVQIWNENSCGLRGCDFLLAIVDKAKCYRPAGSFVGKILPLKDDWSEIQVSSQGTAVDVPQASEVKFKLDDTGHYTTLP